ncbi:lens fiber membrane intrinsic protein-like [Anolis sagrei]|uniref:lens fiber membrane intrinsic protein-like n=2 Tax=Anolis sagrei TaxID=38937 RepID=UPI003522AAD2
MSCLRISAGVFSFIGFALLLAALASEFWVQGQLHMGLWKVCLNGLPCNLFGMDVPDYIHATRAFMLMAAVAGAVSFFGLCFLSCCSHPKSMVKVSAIASFIAGLCALIAMATFTGVYSEQYQRIFRTWYDWSLGVGWGSIPFFLLAGVLASKVQTVTVI